MFIILVNHFIGCPWPKNKNLRYPWESKLISLAGYVLIHTIVRNFSFASCSYYVTLEISIFALNRVLDKKKGNTYTHKSAFKLK